MVPNPSASLPLLVFAGRSLRALPTTGPLNLPECTSVHTSTPNRRQTNKCTVVCLVDVVEHTCLQAPDNLFEHPYLLMPSFLCTLLVTCSSLCRFPGDHRSHSMCLHSRSGRKAPLSRAKHDSIDQSGIVNVRPSSISMSTSISWGSEGPNVTLSRIVTENRTAQRHLKELKEVRGLDGRLAEPLRAEEHCRCPQHLFAAAPARLDDGHVLFEGLHGASELLQLILLEEEWRETPRD